MAISILLLALLTTLTPTPTVSQPTQLALDSAEQESVYQVLEAINPTIPWRSLFPDDLCSSAPHGVACDYFTDTDTNTDTPHITQLSFGYVSEYNSNPPCTPNSTINHRLFSLTHLRKLFFYKCFTNTTASFPVFSGFGESLEELVFIENPSLVGDIYNVFGNLSSLRRLVLIGTGVYGEISNLGSDFLELEQITLSRNRLSGQIPLNFSKKLRVLDLSSNSFEGLIPESIGDLSELLKIDLSLNNLSGEIPESFKGLKNLEFLDLSQNQFSNSGIPLFLGELVNLKEVYLSGNKLGGHIPEIWENMGGILGIGFSDMGLVGNIPASMGVFLKNVCYLGLDNNSLEGTVPEELGFLEFVNELNLENNFLSGRIPFSSNFSAKVGAKLKLGGNLGLCVETGGGNLGNLEVCEKPNIPNAVWFSGCGLVDRFHNWLLMFLGIGLGFLFW